VLQLESLNYLFIFIYLFICIFPSVTQYIGHVLTMYSRRSREEDNKVRERARSKAERGGSLVFIPFYHLHRI
jgi:hypothetical protein